MIKQYYVQHPDGNIIATDNPVYHKDAIKLPATKGKELHRQQYIEQMKKHIKQGDTIYGNVESVSRSGMSRVISFYRVDDEKRIINIDYAMHVICGYREAKRGVILNGCGMDMIFAAVYDLGNYLWPNGTPESHGSRNGVPDTDGGYALKHAQL